MMSTIIGSTLPLLYSVIMLWRVSLLFRSFGTLAPFMPFFLWSTVMNALGSLIYYDMSFTFWWFVIDFIFLAAFFGLMLLTIRLINERV